VGSALTGETLVLRRCVLEDMNSQCGRFKFQVGVQPNPQLLFRGQGARQLLFKGQYTSQLWFKGQYTLKLLFRGQYD